MISAINEIVHPISGSCSAALPLFHVFPFATAVPPFHSAAMPLRVSVFVDQRPRRYFSFVQRERSALISATRKHEPFQLNDNPHRLPVPASRWPKARRCDKFRERPRDRLVLAQNQNVHHGEPAVAPCARHQVYPDWGGRRWIPVYNHAAGPSVRIFLSALSWRPRT